MPVKRPSKTPATPLRRLARAIPLLRSPGRAGVLARAILAALALAALPAAAKTYDVDVATGRASAADGAFYHGETVVFRPVRGREPVTNVEYACVYYQTNGMTAWWKTDTLAFHPTNDVGASAYRFFIEGRDGDGRDWHANGTLRMLPSPGFSPNELPLPVATLDFAAVEVFNAPWAEPSDVASAAQSATNYTDAAMESLAAVAHTGSYNDLSGKPTIPTVPTAVSAFANDAGYVDKTVTNALSRRVDGIASTVDNVAAGLAATNNYLLLKGGTVTGIVNVAETTAIYTNQISLVPGHGAGKWGPMIILRRIMGDRIMRGVTIESIDAWDGIATNAATKSALASATNALATVARTGSYNDLSSKPTIPTVPSNISALVNDSGYVDKTVTNALSDRVSSLSSTVNGKVSTNHVGNVKIVGRFAVGGFADGTSSIALGGQCNAEGDNSIALGTKVGTCEGVSGGAPYNPHKGAFAWQGHNGYSSQPYYYSHGQGTFNVNPVGGLRGFWIGETNLADHLAPYATTNDVASAVSAATSGTVPTGYVAYTNALARPRNGSAAHVTVASGATLADDSSAWPDGASVFAVVHPLGTYTVAGGLSLVGHAAWPTQDFQCVAWRVGRAVMVNVVSLIPQGAGAVDFGADGAPAARSPTGWSYLNDTVVYQAGGNAVDLVLASGGPLSASAEGWPDGQAVLVSVHPAGPYSPAASLSLVGYASWPTEDFYAVVWRVGQVFYVSLL